MHQYIYSTVGLCFHFSVLLTVVSLVKAKLPLLLSRMNEVSKVFMATNSDYKYTEVRWNFFKLSSQQTSTYL